MKALLIKNWKSILAIIVVLGALILDVYLLFGILYIVWAILGLKSGHAFIIEDVKREDCPIIFWIITLIWLFSGIYVLIAYSNASWILYCDYSCYMNVF